MARSVLKIILCVFIVCCLVTGVDGSRRDDRRSRMTRRGSSIYTRSTWKAAFEAGTVIGGSGYLKSRRYASNPHRMPTICTNYDLKNESGYPFKYFVCPAEGDPENYNDCCGKSKREYCCHKTFKVWIPVVAVVGSLILAALVSSAAIFFICRKKEARKIHALKPKTSVPSNVVKTEEKVQPTDFVAAGQMDQLPFNPPEKLPPPPPYPYPATPPPPYSQ